MKLKSAYYDVESDELLLKKNWGSHGPLYYCGGYYVSGWLSYVGLEHRLLYVGKL